MSSLLSHASWEEEDGLLAVDLRINCSRWTRGFPRARSLLRLDSLLDGSWPLDLAHGRVFSLDLFLFLQNWFLALWFGSVKNNKTMFLATPKITALTSCFLNHIPLESPDLHFLFTLEKMHKLIYPKTSHAHKFCFIDPIEMNPIVQDIPLDCLAIEFYLACRCVPYQKCHAI